MTRASCTVLYPPAPTSTSTPGSTASAGHVAMRRARPSSREAPARLPCFARGAGTSIAAPGGTSHRTTASGPSIASSRAAMCPASPTSSGVPQPITATRARGSSAGTPSRARALSRGSSSLARRSSQGAVLTARGWFAKGAASPGTSSRSNASTARARPYCFTYVGFTSR
uniref:Uncharacterized protein n=1 Tax=Myxococcus xanthus TaxID=34 RepID=Q93ND5_MYXXA|nr:unknown [Myxococcus xanthus DZF1]